MVTGQIAEKNAINQFSHSKWDRIDN